MNSNLLDVFISNTDNLGIIRFFLLIISLPEIYEDLSCFGEVKKSCTIIFCHIFSVHVTCTDVVHLL